MGELIIRDGQDSTIGATTDAAVTTDADATLAARLRGLVNILANVWDVVNGRIKVDCSAAKPPIVTGSISAVNGAVSCELGNAKGVTFGTAGTFADLSCIFEASIDNSNWYPVFAQRLAGTTVRATSLYMGDYNHSLLAAVDGFRWFRVRVTKIASGMVTIWIARTDTPSVSSYDAAITYVYPHVAVSYGYSNYHAKVSLATTNGTSVKPSAAQVGHIALANTHPTAWRYVKFYDKASMPVVGTDTPCLIYAIPPQKTVDIHNQSGLRFLSGLAYAITALPAITDMTAIGADEVIVNIIYL